MQGDQERRVPDGLQHLSLSDSVFCRLGLVHDGCLLELLESVQLALVRSCDLAGEKHLAVGPCAQHTQQLKVCHADAAWTPHVHCQTQHENRMVRCFVGDKLLGENDLSTEAKTLYLQ